MKKIIKVVLILILVVVVGVAGVAMYVKTAMPGIAAPADLKIEITPERVERGKYLANSVAVCMDCHTPRDWTKFTGPIKQDVLAAGGDKFGREMGLPGTIYTRNLTPHALGSWTDGELYRAITSGVRKDGTVLFPLMPYQTYGKMDKEDIYSVIAYIRTLAPVKNEIPDSEFDFPLNLIINTIPEEPNHKPIPNPSNSVEYGKYLVSMASCGDCHSKRNQEGIIPGTEFGGGEEFKITPGTVTTSANISPDMQTGIGKWTKEMFITRFKSLTDSTNKPRDMKPGEANTPMPWYMYATMSEQDLGAIYDYLRTVTPISNNVVKFKHKQ